MKSTHLQHSTAQAKAAYIAAQHDYLQRIAEHCDYAITLLTSLCTAGIKARTMEDRHYKAQASLRQLRNKLNRLLTGNGYKRNSRYLPVFVAAIEGTTNDYDLNRTLHIHIALGNTGHEATEATRRLLEDGIRQIWAATEVGTADIKVDSLTKGTEHRWMDYIGKEAHRGQSGNTGVIDYSNTQIPAPERLNTRKNRQQHRQACELTLRWSHDIYILRRAMLTLATVLVGRALSKTHSKTHRQHQTQQHTMTDTAEEQWNKMENKQQRTVDDNGDTVRQTQKHRQQHGKTQSINTQGGGQKSAR